ncbi:GAF and ANTAR domain-containing protein [Amycolatopsis decaplanina]|uniref:ANTAR domain-containing protein n=1 Tax=Amycolatopsis decaplanina DSM 44594 TaxID=1284240 RepID=M2XT87_9PSEU|nr:GAF and ANTAR domain-containing protein [Amycolatopsis decaplanina]EME52385.1 ANTAR domain-containing protein [Amycolatopsis decaplanina DSM 44594]
MPATHRETLVAEAVLELATRSHDSDALDLLHDLTTCLVTLLGLRAAGATIPNEAGQVDYLTASDEVCRQLEQDQFELDEGPCVDSTRSGTALPPIALHPPGLGPQRWPRFTPRALRVGITHVAAVPLRAGKHTLGAVNLMSVTPAAPTESDLRLAQALADAAGSWLSQHRTQRTKDEIIDQLQTALNARIVIEQAKGVLAAHLKINVDEAFHRLRAHARNRRLKLTELAARIARGDIPSELSPTH